MIFFFSTEDFNSLEHCQSKQTVSYNVEWCLQLQYVECSGDTWYCDTELLSKVMSFSKPTRFPTQPLTRLESRTRLKSTGSPIESRLVELVL